MKNYVKPQVDIIKIAAEDILSASQTIIEEDLIE